MSPSVFVHMVTYNSSPCVVQSMLSVLSQEKFTFGENLFLQCTDNASTNKIADEITKHFREQVPCHRNKDNLGFSGAHNQGVYRFLQSSAQYLLILNPDTKLTPQALHTLVQALECDDTAGAASPLLLRCDHELHPLEPAVVDAAGMIMTADIRHLDRGSGQPLGSEYQSAGYVFGGTGACLLLRRACVEDLLLPSPGGAEVNESDVWKLYPALREGAEKRSPLFDEAFFAYREDADLAWRAQILGWRTCFVPQAVVYHERRVTPERRSKIPAMLNRLSVRNRFLLQANNLTASVLGRVWLRGVVVRNVLVILGVLLTEASSIRGLWEALLLMPRALRRRGLLIARAQSRARHEQVASWFGSMQIRRHDT